MRFWPALRLFFILGAVLWQPAVAAETVTLQLKWKHGFQFAGYYMAKELGYYDEAGLTVDVREAAPGQDVVAEVVAGRAQFGVGTSSLVLERNAGQPVVVLGVIFQHSPLVLLARRHDALANIHGVAGQRVMFEPHAEELIYYLAREGVPLDSLRRLPHSFSVQDLIDGKTDLISAYVTNEPFSCGRPESITRSSRRGRPASISGAHSRVLAPGKRRSYKKWVSRFEWPRPDGR